MLSRDVAKLLAEHLVFSNNLLVRDLLCESLAILDGCSADAEIKGVLVHGVETLAVWTYTPEPCFFLQLLGSKINA
jgi:hypothetical protein